MPTPIINTVTRNVESPYPLNNVKGSVAAYALRKLRSSASKAVRVRRSGDDAEKDIVFSGKDLDIGALSDFISSFSYTNAVTNGDFSSGTTGWITAFATKSSSNNVLFVTGNGTGNAPQANFVTSVTHAVGRKVYLTADVRVTNSDCTSISISSSRGTGGYDNIAVTQSTPSINTWYSLKGIATVTETDGTKTLGVTIRSSYVDSATANGKIMEIKNVMCIDLFVLSQYISSTISSSQCNSLFPFTATTANTSAQSAYITKWYDQSGNGNDAVQTTAANQPRIVNAGTVDVDAKGKPCVQTILANDTHFVVKNTSLIQLTSEATFNLILTPNTTGEGGVGRFIDKNSTIDYSFYTYSINNALTITPGILTSDNNAISFNSLNLITVTKKTGTNNLNFYSNGLSKGVATSSSWPTSNENLFIFNRSALDRQYDGTMSELIIFNQGISDPQRTKLERNQSKHYGIKIT